MDRAEKRRFIEDLTASIAEDLINKIPQMPEAWDGLELRELLAEKFHDSCWMSSASQERAFRARFREYRNEVVVRNL